MSSLRARATIILVFRAPLGPSVRLRNHCASALSFWNMRNRQASWIRPRRTLALPDFVRPFSRRLKPLSSGDPVRPAYLATALRSRKLRESTSCTSMSAVSMPTPRMPASSRTIACGRRSGAWFNRSRRARSIPAICSRITASRARSRRISSSVFGGIGKPSGVRSVSRRCSARRSSGLKPRMPSRARAAFMRLTMRVRSPTRFSCSRLGRLASSSSIVGTATMPQCPRSPRSHPMKTRISMAVSSRSVLARLCSRETATLVG